MKNQLKILQTEALIIGSGGAGLRAAIELHDSGKDVLIVGKCKKRDAHTILATGGINAALGNMDSEDSWELHAADTLREGWFINDPKGVEMLCKNAKDAIKELDSWGTKFAKDKNGKILQRFFGAATYRRACFVGDHTGREILNTLVDQVEKRKIPFLSEVYIFSLMKNKTKNGVNGAIGLNLKNRQLIVIQAKAVVLATGGHSRMFERSSSRFWENNGDGIKLAHDVAAVFQDMEMFQFHPTGMVHPKQAEGILVTEAVRGEGGILLNIKGERVMKHYDPERMELSARDIVARAIYSEVEKGNGTKHGGVYLDISQIPKKTILERLPTIYSQFKNFVGIDISKEKMEVAPTAHYSMAGIRTNFKTGETSVKGLYAIGEVTGGMHGANRLGGNSLLEIIVCGKMTGKYLAKQINQMKLLPLDEVGIEDKSWEFNLIADSKAGKNPIEVKKEIQAIMWKHAGVVRTGKELKQGLKRLKTYQNVQLKIKDLQDLEAALDVRNMLPTCEMILLSALERKESRGAHFRKDFPKTSKKWKKNILCTPKNGKIQLKTAPIAKIPAEIQKVLKSTLKAKAHLLE